MEAAEWTFRNSVSAAMFFLFVWAVFVFFKDRLSSGLRITLLVLVGIRLFLPFSPASSLSINTWFPSTRGLVEPATIETLPTGREAPVSTVVNQTSAHPVGFAGVCTILWISVLLGLFALAVISQIVTRRKIERLKEVDDADLLSLVRECGIPHSVRVVESPDRKTIAVFGSLRVTHLLLPRHVTTLYDRKEITGILRHESEHICGNDLLWNWLVFAMQCWHWFNPFVWIAGRYWRSEREIVCDHAALGNLSDSERRSYGSALIKALEINRPMVAGSPALVPFFRHKSELKLRLHYIMKNRPYQFVPQLGTIVLAFAFAIATFTSADEKGDVKRPDEPGKAVEKPDTGIPKKDGDPGGKKPEGDKPRVAPDNSKEAKVFKAYDKNQDSFVDDKEMEAMMEGKQNSRGRREIRKAIDRADQDNDGKLNKQEFIWWYTVGRRDEKAENG